MKRGWEIKKLSELFTIKPPKKLAKEKLDDEDEISFVPMACLNIEDRDLSLKQSKQLKDAYKGYTYFADNDVLLAKITPCFENGKVGIAKGLLNGIGFGSSEFIVFRPNGHVVPEYLYYYLSQESFRDEGKNRMAGAVGHKRVSKEFIEEYLLPFPESTKEQNRIVAILDKAFTAIDKAKANAEKNLANAKELFESYLNGIFENPGKDWEEKKLGEVYDVRDGTHDSPKYHDSGYPLITSKNLKDDEIVYDKIKYISKTDYLNINKRSEVNISDVLFAMIGTIGNPVVVTKQPDYAIKNVALFKVSSSQSSWFLKYYLGSKFVTNKMAKEAKGTTQKFVGLGYLRSFSIILPALPEQKRIVSKLDVLSAEIKHLERIYQQKIEDVEELKKSILQKAFEGEL